MLDLSWQAVLAFAYLLDPLKACFLSFVRCETFQADFAQAIVFWSCHLVPYVLGGISTMLAGNTDSFQPRLILGDYSVNSLQVAFQPALEVSLHMREIWA